MGTYIPTSAHPKKYCRQETYGGILGVCTSRSPLFYIKSQISMAFTEVSEKLWGYSCAHPKLWGLVIIICTPQHVFTKITIIFQRRLPKQVLKNYGDRLLPVHTPIGLYGTLDRYLGVCTGRSP